MALPHRDPAVFPRSVVWTRGPGCAELAAVLSTDSVEAVASNPVQSCIEHRADMAVMRSLGSFDLVPVAVPSGLSLTRTEEVVAAVSTGSHSDLAATVAVRIATALEVDARAVTAVQPGAPRASARERLTEVRNATGLVGEVVEVPTAADIVSGLEEGSLVVLGAPGGSWLTRQFFGPGARLRAHAPAGTIVVRDSPTRAFQCMVEAEGIGIHTRAADAVRVTSSPTVPVIAEGKLVGIVRRGILERIDPGVEVGEIMEEPPYVEVEDAIESLVELVEFFDHGPIPVVDRRGTLVGALPSDVL